MNSPLSSTLSRIFLKPGELFLSRNPAIVSTILGSCVSITFFSKTSGLGAMCHVLLPSGSIFDGFRYLDSTLDYMVEKISEIGILTESCDVKLFGGADVILMTDPSGYRLSIGSQNISIAQQRLDLLGIVTKAIDVGGKRGRKLVFNTQTGDVFVKKLGKSEF